MKVEPIAFGPEHKALLQHSKFLLEKQRFAISPKFDKLLTSLKTAVHNSMELDKDATADHDILDAFRLCMRAFREGAQGQTFS